MVETFETFAFVCIALLALRPMKGQLEALIMRRPFMFVFASNIFKTFA